MFDVLFLFPVYMAFISFSCFVPLAKTSGPVMKVNSETRHSCLVLGRKHSIYNISCRFLDSFFHVEEIDIPNLLRV